MQRRIVVTTLSLAAVVTAGVALCGRRAVSTHGVALAAASKGEGLVFRLSEGVEEAASARPAAGGPTEPLTEQETQRVLDRLPAMTPEPDQARDFALREKSLPPPRTGKTVSAPFPPAAQVEGPRTGAAGALEVVRHAPDGDVALAPNLSVTFSQPMVAVTSQEEAAQTVPVRLTPTPPGKWRWVGTKTLLFEPTGRFPMATVYKAEIPAGTKPALGGTLARAFEWRFSTPPPTIVEKYPADRPTPRGPLIFVAFDQKIDDAAVLGTITVTAGTTRATLRLAAPAEIQADAQVRELAARAERGRWLAFLPVEPLPGDSAVRVTVGPRTPSLEGPRETVKKQEWTFRTYGPMRVTSHRCGWEPTCRPSNPWQIEFSNQIDARKFTKEMVRVVPELPGMKVASGGNWLTISGASRGMTSYKVTLAAELPDEFGQTLAAAQTLTFDVDKAQPSLLFPGGSMVVLDPVAPPALSVYSTQQPSLDVKAYAVAPDDWAAFLKFSQHEKDAGPPGRLVFTKKLVPQADVSEQVETSIDLAEALPSKLGQLVVVVDPAIRPKERWRGDSVRVWVQSTRIGLDAFVDSTDLTVWATNLADGKPLADVSLELSPNGGKASSTADGLATLSLSSQPLKVLVARKGQDVAILTDTDYYWSNGWQRGARGDGAIWHVFDDRGLYRPGEEARVKGWVRAAGYGQGGDVAAFSETTRTLTYILKDSRGNEVTKGQAALNAFGGFDLALRLPKTMNLGPAALALDVAAPGCCTHLVHALRVQEFRRPEFEVTAKTNEGPFFIGGHALVTAKAAYYAGGVLASAETTWRVTATAGSFVPPGRDDFIFGHWKPWWEHDGYDAAESQPSTLPGRTGADGQHILRIDFDSARPPQAWSVRAEASIKDVNRQEWTATSTMLVHPASVYVGLRSERLFVQQGQPLQLSVIATDLDGRAAAGRPVTLRAERLDWEQDAGEWKERVVDPQTREVASAERAVRAEFATKEGGTYRVTATVADEQGRINETQIRLWVAGGKQPARRNVEQEKVTLIPDKKEYRAGETAEILVVAPFANSEGLLTLRRSGIVRTERFRMQASSHTLKVKIEEAWTPNVYAQVDLVGAAPRADDQGRVDTKLAPRPAFASGSLDLAVPPYQRTLTLAVTPKDKALEPAGSTEVTVQVRDASGQPLAHAEVALVVADEAVLALAGYELADPLKSIYPHRDPGAQDRHQRTALLLAAPEAVAEPQALGVDKGRLRSLAYIQNNAVAGGAALDMAIPPPAAAPMPRRAMQVVTKSGVMPQQLEDEKAGAGEAQPIALRADFNPLALFVASAVTDAQGRATATVKLPDNVTRYRVMAVATDGAKRFGKGESTITARLPLMVRPSAPRFLNFGDRFELPIVVQNQTDAPIKVDVAARALNAAFLADAAAVAQGSDKTAPSSGRRVTVPANDRVEVRLPATAVRAGTARFQIGAVSGRWSDAADVSLPVWTPATTEAFATYGQIDNEKPIVQPIQAPSAVVREYGGLEVTTSSTALSALTDAVMYLAKYPYGCAEQISSRVLAVAALKDVLAAFQAEGLPARDEMLAAVKRDLDRLKALQNNDGGFAFWRYGDESWPYVSIHAAHAMVRAQEKGFAVDAQALDKAKKYLREIESHIPKWYGDNARRTLIAYALSVRQRLGDRDTARARKLIAEVGVEKLSFEAIGWLLGVLSGDPESQIEVAAIRHFLANRATETASTAHFAVDYGDSAYVLLYSDRRADAIVLDALIGDQPANDLIPKLVEGLLGHRTAGRWLNTQENVFILLALDRYFNTYEKVTPDFVARAWLGDRYAGEHAFRGRTTERSHIEIPMEHLGSAGKTQDLIVAKEGKGRLYYRIGMQYAPASLTLQPADYGFTVERRYEGLDKKDDVRRDAAGVWHVKAGSRVRVTLTMVAPSRRYHVALADPLPAGLEPLNPELATTGTIPQGPGEDVTLVGGPGLGGPSRPGMWWWWTRTWYEHQNMRDERVEAFTSLLFEGVYRYSYAAQATTPGVFVVPPPKAEEMYHPETFGRGGTDRLVVE